MRSSALDSSNVLLSYSIISLAQYVTIILILPYCNIQIYLQ